MADFDDALLRMSDDQLAALWKQPRREILGTASMAAAAAAAERRLAALDAALLAMPDVRAREIHTVPTGHWTVQLADRVIYELDFFGRRAKTVYEPPSLTGAGEASTQCTRLVYEYLTPQDNLVALELLNPEQRAIIDLLIKGTRVCMQAAAGTGKSFVSRWYARYCDMKQDEYQAVAYTALAASLVQGITVNSCFRLQLAQDTCRTYVSRALRRRHQWLNLERDLRSAEEALSLARTAEDKDRLQREVTRLRVASDADLTGATTRWRALMVDEVSYLHPSLFLKMMSTLAAIRTGRTPNEYGEEDEEPEEAEAGRASVSSRPRQRIQLLLSGDIFQAGPINGKPSIEYAAAHPHLIAEYQANKQLLFDSPAWRKQKITMVLLHEVLRQRNPIHVHVLTMIRFGLITPLVRLFLATRSIPRATFLESEQRRQLDCDIRGVPCSPITLLTGTRAQAASHNLFMIHAASGPAVRTPMRIYYVHRDVITGYCWHALIKLGDLDFNYHRLAATDKLPVPGDRRHPFGLELEKRIARDVKRFIESRTQSEPVLLLKTHSAVMFTQNDPFNTHVINGQSAYVSSLGQTGGSTYGYEAQHPPSPFEWIRMAAGPPPLDLRRIEVTLPNGARTDVMSIRDHIPLNPDELLKLPHQLTDCLVVDQPPLRLLAAATCDKITGVELDKVAVDGPSLRRRDSYGLCYVACSRVRSLDDVTLLDVDELCIGARVNAILYFRRQLPFFSALSDAAFKQVLARGTVVRVERNYSATTAAAAANAVEVDDDVSTFSDDLFRVALPFEPTSAAFPLHGDVARAAEGADSRVEIIDESFVV